MDVERPLSMGEVEQLILELYQPGSPQRISHVQDGLQKLQRSSYGWELGNALLGSKEEKVRFFGALTFTVKLNSDWTDLDEVTAGTIRDQLINWLIRLLLNSEGPLVLKKLCSTLALFFLRFPETWSRCIRQLTCSLSAGESLSSEVLSKYPSIQEVLHKLQPIQNKTLTWFASNLAEEAEKADSNNINNQNLHYHIRLNIEDVVSTIAYNLSTLMSTNGQTSSSRTILCQETIKSFQSWVFYSHKAFIDTAVGFDQLKSLNPLTIQCLSFDDMFEVTLEVLTDILTNYSSFLREQDFTDISAWFRSRRAESKYSSLTSGDFDFESLSFGRFMLAFADAMVQEMAQNLSSSTTTIFMDKLHGLLSCPGYPVAEDEICSLTLEYWSTFVEFMIDSLFAEEKETAPWIGSARVHVVRVVEECWAKIHVPPSDILASWDSNTKAGFREFRKDVADLLQSSYTFLGFEIFQKLIDLALQSMQGEAWIDTEATLYCLNALSDSIAADESEDKALSALFGSPLFARLSDAAAGIPGKTRHSAVTVVGNYANFFERHTEFLPSALNFLFSSVENASQAASASRSILSLCFSCRKALTGELNIFLQHYQGFANSNSTDSLTKERVLGAIAAIVEALPNDEAKIEPLGHLLSFVEQDSQMFSHYLSSHDLENAKMTGLTVLQCLFSIGKGMQEPEDGPVDLEDETSKSNIWTDGVGGQIQHRVVTAVTYIFDAFSNDGDIVEAACSVFRTGFTETRPGPFVFQPRLVAQFLSKSTMFTPRVGFMLSTACSLVTCYGSDSSARIDEEAFALLDHFLGLVQKMQDTMYDPELAQSAVDYMTRLMPRYLNVMLEVAPSSRLEAMFIFTLHCLGGNEILPKRSASSFWTTFLMLTELPQSQQAVVKEIILGVGPNLAEVLINNFGGNAARSELDSLSEPLKKLVFKQPMAKKWLEAALSNPSFPSQKVNSQEKKVFLAKVMALRGAKGTNQVVKEFWMACRGTSFSYTS